MTMRTAAGMKDIVTTHIAVSAEYATTTDMRIVTGVEHAITTNTRTVIYVKPVTVMNMRTATYAETVIMAGTVKRMDFILMKQIMVRMIYTAIRHPVKQESIMPDFTAAAGKNIIHERTANWIVIRKIIKTPLYGRGF